MVLVDFGFNFDDMLRSSANPKSSKKGMKRSAYNPIMDGIDLTGVMYESQRPFKNQKSFKKGQPFKKAPNAFFDGLDLKGTLNYGGVDLSNGYGNEMLSGNFFKYLNTGGYGDIRGVGKESKKSKGRRTVRYSESRELYGMEGLENALTDSIDTIDNSGRKIRQNIAKKVHESKYKPVRTLAMKSDFKGDLSGIKSRVKAFGTRRKIKKSLEPDFDTGMSSDRSKEISETYGEVRPDPRYELSKRKYDYDDDYKRDNR